jgi:preprotein translocase subunit SecA
MKLLVATVCLSLSWMGLQDGAQDPKKQTDVQKQETTQSTTTQSSTTPSQNVKSVDGKVVVAKKAIKVIVDGKELVFGANGPREIMGRTMVPFRPLFESLGADVEYDLIHKQVTAEKENIRFELKTLYEFLKSKIKKSEISDSDLENYLIIACEKIFTDNLLIITLRATYTILLEQYQKEILKERNEVIQLGGLHVIGTERHESRRIDNQLRGRSGRQGDPGSSRFFLSLEDNLLRIFGGDRIGKLMESLKVDDDIPIESMLLNKSLESAQKKVEAYYYDARKQLFEYDEVLNYQRQAIYSERRRILESNNLRDWVIQYAETTVLDYFNYYLEKDNFSLTEQAKLLDKVENLLGLPYEIDRKIFSNFLFLYENWSHDEIPRFQVGRFWLTIAPKS